MRPASIKIRSLQSKAATGDLFVLAALLVAGFAFQIKAGVETGAYSNGFEANTDGWFSDLNLPTPLAIDNVSRTVGSNKFSVDGDATAPAEIALSDD